MTTSSSNSPSYIHGGTDAQEVARLEKQAHLAWTFVGPRFLARPGERVLDLATGVGAMAERIREHHPDVRLVGVDLRMSQLHSAKTNHPGIDWLNANGAALPFRSGSFDRVHCSWLLEHVREPLPILREVHRVLRPGGTAHFVEVDNATFRTVPHDPDIQGVMDALNRAQQEAGGDPFVGQQLGHLFLQAGFAKVELSPAALHGTHAEPKSFRALVEEFAEIFEGLDESLDPQAWRRAQLGAKKLRALLATPGAEMAYSSVLAVATR